MIAFFITTCFVTAEPRFQSAFESWIWCRNKETGFVKTKIAEHLNDIFFDQTSKNDRNIAQNSRNNLDIFDKMTRKTVPQIDLDSGWAPDYYENKVTAKALNGYKIKILRGGTK